MIKIYGKNVVKEALKTNHMIEHVYLTNDYEKKEVKIMEMIKERNIDFSFVTNRELDKLTQGLHQGIVAIAKEYEYYSLDLVLDGNRKQFFIILDGLEDPQNLGAILRTADATGLDGIIIPKNRSVSLSPTVAKVSVGAIEHVKIIQVNSLNHTIDLLKEKGFWIVGTDMLGNVDYRNLDCETSLGIIIGSEGFGISRSIKKKCDYLVSVPMIGHVNSLNASVTAAILMYEIYRKR